MDRRMHEGQPSATAQRVAVRRAAHQLVDEPRVFDDPLALGIIGEQAVAELRRSLSEEQAAWNQALRAFMAARSRFAEDCLAQAYLSGVRQYVVLGAGLDTFGCRNPWPDLKVFEVDHPSTQAWKRKRISLGGLQAPASLVFAPVDFETQALADGLAAAGFDARAPAFFSWLGVVMYLTEAAAFETLSFVAGLPAGSGIVFDFPVPLEKMSLVSRMATRAMADRVAALGEPFRSAYDREDLEQRLIRAGFTRAETLGSDELNRLYFPDRRDGLRLRGPGRLARAAV
jgi:methyltransferase (TIGR00027 family)